jgi:hypothetical protein
MPTGDAYDHDGFLSLFGGRLAMLGTMSAPL